MIPAVGAIPEEVEALVLFGSQGRGDSDSFSDVDVAAFVRADSTDALVRAKRKLCEHAPECNFSVYSIATARLMAGDGSLFLWHLKREGKYMFLRGQMFVTVMDSLKPYSCEKALRDISTFEEVIEDVQKSLRDTPDLLLYESATLFSILRSLGMIASTVDGHPIFRRVEPIRYLRRLMDETLPMADADIDRLVTARHLYARNLGSHVEIDETFVLRAAETVASAARFVRSHVGARIQ